MKMRKNNDNKYRIFLGSVMTIILILCIMSITNGWHVGVTRNTQNRLSTSMELVELITMNRPIRVIGGENAPFPFPNTVGELFTQDNLMTSLGKGSSGRKFFEYDGRDEIVGASPGFRMIRPLIIANNSDNAMSYTVAFPTRDVAKQSLRSVFYFNYTKLGDDVPLDELRGDSTFQLNKGSLVENLATSITSIGSDAPIHLPANTAHIYLVDMGILQSAGNSSIDTSFELDILLSSTQSNNRIHTVSDEQGLIKAFEENSGSDTIMLSGDIALNTSITVKKPFNLELNGHTLYLDDTIILEIIYPRTQASIDIGSSLGGRIIGAEAMQFVGVSKKSVLNWYTDITGLDAPAVYTNVYLNQLEVGSEAPPVSSDTSSEPSSSTERLPEYQSYDSIVQAEYFAEGDGSQQSPFAISTREELKLFFESNDTTSQYIVTAKISKIKNIPEKLIPKNIKLKFAEDAAIYQLDINTSNSPPSIPFPNIKVYNALSYPVNDAAMRSTYIHNITYWNGG